MTGHHLSLITSLSISLPDRQILLCVIFNAMLWKDIVTRNTIAVEPQHLKDKEKNIGLTKSYCITISIQKINSIHKFVFKIQQILRSHELTSPMPTQKLFDQLLIFVISVSICKKYLFHLFILQIQSILKSIDQIGHTYSWPCRTKKISINFSFS